MAKTLQIPTFAVIALILSLPCLTVAASGHSHSVHALQDLRLASALLQRTDATQPTIDQPDETKLAIDSIEGAIAEINDASIGDGTNKTGIPQVDPRVPRQTRLVKSLELLDKAQQDWSKEREGAGVSGLQARVSAQIDQARNRVRVAIAVVNFDYSESVSTR